jgi:hypothetical protein
MRTVDDGKLPESECDWRVSVQFQSNAHEEFTET